MKKIDLPITTTREDSISPLKPDFKWLGIMLGFCSIILIALFSLSTYISKIVVAEMSIEKERKYFGSFMLQEDMQVFDISVLENKKAEDFFKDTPIYIVENDTENAFASLGANIFLHSGLLKNIENKEELLFILGHEMRHIENRDVLIGFSKELPLQMSLEYLGLNIGNSLIDTNKLLVNFRSRDHEYKADQGGIELLNSLEMNSKCATGFFTRVGGNFEKYTEFIATHPESKKRRQIIESASKFPEKKCSKWDWSK